VMFAFARSKAAPLPSFLLNMTVREDVNHRPVTLRGELLKMSHPITYDDVWHAMEEPDLPQDLFVSALALLGAGLITYQPEEQPGTRKTPRRNQ